MGADRGILVNDPALAGADALGVAKALAAAIKGDGELPSLIFTGKLAIDDYGASVAQCVAEILGIGQMMVVDNLEVSDAGAKASRRVEGGAKEMLEASFPVLVACEKGLNEPRYASLPGIMKAKKKKIDEKKIADLGLSAADVAPKVKVLKFTLPPERAAGQKIEPKDAAEAAQAIVNYLHNEAKIL
ncbi:MAG: electron transfer flavoprotein subunit beta/FixA family protein, partial [Myxococcales bacterium]|nr:electron transfer flavoprotein subunit beta/FixA family protein [Myxococcales bacterium]